VSILRINFLLCFSGVALVFIFSWLLMLAVVLLFVTGGTTYSELCNPMLQTEPSSGVVRVSTVPHVNLLALVPCV